MARACLSDFDCLPQIMQRIRRDLHRTVKCGWNVYNKSIHVQTPMSRNRNKYNKCMSMHMSRATVSLESYLCRVKLSPLVARSQLHKFYQFGVLRISIRRCSYIIIVHLIKCVGITLFAINRRTLRVAVWLQPGKSAFLIVHFFFQFLDSRYWKGTRGSIDS